MLSPLASVAVATLCCYTPATLASTLLCFKLRKTPIPATWFLLLLVCLSKFTALMEKLSSRTLTWVSVRLAGGVLSLLLPDRNAGINAAAFAFLSAGGLPLLLVTILLLNIMWVVLIPVPRLSE